MLLLLLLLLIRFACSLLLVVRSDNKFNSFFLLVLRSSSVFFQLCAAPFFAIAFDFTNRATIILAIFDLAQPVLHFGEQLHLGAEILGFRCLDGDR